MTISFREVAELLRYEAETGEFTWLPRQGTPQWNSRHANKVAGGRNKDGYVLVTIGSRKHRAHRLAWLCVYGRLPVGEIDHVNGDRSDNRICNLREATHSQNMHNVGPTKRNTSGLKGIVFRKDTCLWQARIQVAGRRFSLGFFKSASEAHEAYAQSAQRLHGEFARTE